MSYKSGNRHLPQAARLRLGTAITQETFMIARLIPAHIRLCSSAENELGSRRTVPTLAR